MVLTNDESIPAPNEPNKSNEPNELSDSTNAPSTADLFVNTLRDWYVLASDSLASLLDGRFLQQPARDLWLLGKHYPLDGPEYPATVTDDFARLIWCTYRSNYAPIAQSQYTTDAGWGCMLRAGQTLMAQALLLHRLGRDWAFSWAGDIRSRRLYTRTVEEFLDDYSPRCTFSIQRMAAMGHQFQGKDIGEWFGPHGTARILRGLARQADHDVSVYTTTDTVYLADICAGEFQPTLILVASMLGIDRVNPVYYPFIQASLMLPQSAGIAGGRPSSALYFAGVQGDELLYLDPHFTRPAVDRHESGEYSQDDLSSYSCTTPRRIPMSRLDPCMVFGYYCGSLEALIDLRSRIEMLADDGITAILSFDNGHAPSSAIPESVVLDNPVNPEPGILGNPEPRVLTKLPNDDASSINSSDAKTKSESGEIILEGECSEEEWVTEL